MGEVSQEVKDAVIALMEKSSGKGKKEVYPKTIKKELKEQFSKPEILAAIDQLVLEEKLQYWSYGSTAALMLKADYEAKLAASEA
ncbi:dissimilatory sulfite reductase D family protein [Patescibacteria group bacterium]